MLSAETSEERWLNLIRNSDRSYLDAHGSVAEPVTVKEFTVKSAAAVQKSWPVAWMMLVLLGIALAAGPTLVYNMQKSAYRSPPAPTEEANPVPEMAAVMPVPKVTRTVEAPARKENSRVPAYESVLPEQVVPDFPLRLSTPPVRVTQPPVVVHDRFRILGLMIGADSNAVLEDRRSKQTYTVHVGEHIDGIMVKEIRPEKVIFESGGRITELTR